MLEQLLKTIEFPEALNFDLEEKIVKSKSLVIKYAPDDVINYESRPLENLDYIKDWGYRSDNHGQWVCLDINIKKDKLDDVFSKLNELLGSYNKDIIDIANFNSDNYNSKPTQCKCDDEIRIDFLKVEYKHLNRVESTLSIQIVKFQPIIKT
jgi:hypothetical protein